jgi:hypothetical protein
MTDTETMSVDTPEELEKVLDLMQEDPLLAEYRAKIE